MPLPPTGDTGDGPDDDAFGDGPVDDELDFRPPLPLEDRIWRHPSEVAAAKAQTAGPASARRSPHFVTVAVVSGLIGATLTAGVVAALGGFENRTRVVERQVAVQPVTPLADDGIAAIAERTSPSVAGLYVFRGDDHVAGTAVVLRSDGYLLTNAHLVDDADAIEVRLHDAAVQPAEVVGVDEATDVAVLRVDADRLEPATMGTADGLRVGDEVVPMSHAHGSATAGSVERALVAALDQRLRTPSGTVLHGMIVLDTALPADAGGGPLLDTAGAVVGITNLVPVTAEGEAPRTVATPSDVALHAADQIIEYGYVKHVWLGVEGVDLSPDEASAMGLGGGAAIRRVIEGSPAEAAGLADGDVIVAVDGRRVASMSEVIDELRTHEPGDEAELTVRRDDEEVETTATLEERSADTD